MIDWIGMLFTLAGSFTVIKKIKYGFLLMMIGCLWWCLYGYLNDSIAIIITNVVFTGTNIYGFLEWHKDER